MASSDGDEARRRPKKEKGRRFRTFGRHNLISLLVLDHAVLVDAALVLEGVGPHNSLVGLDGHARVLLDHVARGRDVDGVDPSSEIRTATGRSLLSKMRRALQGQGHHYFF